MSKESPEQSALLQPVVPSTPMDALLSRLSCDSLAAPAPGPALLGRILSAGLCAPDHGKLRPWRYVVITGEAREAFAHKIAEAIARQEPELPEAKRQKRLRRFRTTETIIALGMRLRPEHKIPLWEQRMAIGAGAMNVLNALHFEGFGGIWISGAFCHDGPLAWSLGLDSGPALSKKHEEKKKKKHKHHKHKTRGKVESGAAEEAPYALAGFLLIGTPQAAPLTKEPQAKEPLAKKDKAPRRPDIAEYMAFWTPEEKVMFGVDGK